MHQLLLGVFRESGWQVDRALGLAVADVALPHQMLRGLADKALRFARVNPADLPATARTPLAMSSSYHLLVSWLLYAHREGLLQSTSVPWLQQANGLPVGMTSELLSQIMAPKVQELQSKAQTLLEGTGATVTLRFQGNELKPVRCHFGIAYRGRAVGEQRWCLWMNQNWFPVLDSVPAAALWVDDALQNWENTLMEGVRNYLKDEHLAAKVAHDAYQRAEARLQSAAEGLVAQLTPEEIALLSATPQVSAEVLATAFRAALTAKGAAQD